MLNDSSHSTASSQRILLLNVGFGNLVSVSRLIAVVSPDSAPIKRLVQDSRDAGRVIDATCGRKTRAVVIMDSDHVILSPLACETLASRLSGKSKNIDSNAASAEENDE